jgi:hypothetical protein
VKKDGLGLSQVHKSLDLMSLAFVVECPTTGGSELCSREIRGKWASGTTVVSGITSLRSKRKAAAFGEYDAESRAATGLTANLQLVAHEIAE